MFPAQGEGGATLGGPQLARAPKAHATAGSCSELVGELGKFLVDTLNDATRIADGLDGGAPANPQGDRSEAQVRPVASGFMERQSQDLRDCMSVARAIRGQLQRLDARL